MARRFPENLYSMILPSAGASLSSRGGSETEGSKGISRTFAARRANWYLPKVASLEPLERAKKKSKANGRVTPIGKVGFSRSRIKLRYKRLSRQISRPYGSR